MPRKSLRGKVSLCARFRVAGGNLADPHHAAKFALRSLAQRIETLDREIAALDRELEQLVKQAAPRTVQLLGISTGHAGQLLTTAGNIHGSPARRRSLRYAAPARFAPPPARPTAIGSTPQATATPTGPCT